MTVTDQNGTDLYANTHTTLQNDEKGGEEGERGQQ